MAKYFTRNELRTTKDNLAISMNGGAIWVARKLAIKK